MRELKCALNLPIVIGQTLLPSLESGSRDIGPNRGDRTVRFPVVMAESRESLFSLGGTYSTALFAMIQRPSDPLLRFVGLFARIHLRTTLRFPSGLELKSLAGSFKEAPLKKASFNIDLYNFPVVTLRFRPQYSSIERDVGMTTLSNTPLIRSATADDAARIGAIAHAAFAKYVPRIGREPSPMVADFDAEIAAHRIVVIETAGKVSGYMIAWPKPMRTSSIILPSIRHVRVKA